MRALRHDAPWYHTQTAQGARVKHRSASYYAGQRTSAVTASHHGEGMVRHEVLDLVMIMTMTTMMTMIVIVIKIMVVVVVVVVVVMGRERLRSLLHTTDKARHDHDDDDDDDDDDCDSDKSHGGGGGGGGGGQRKTAVTLSHHGEGAVRHAVLDHVMPTTTTSNLTFF